MKRLTFALLVVLVCAIGYRWPVAGLIAALVLSAFGSGVATGVFLIAWCIGKQDAHVEEIKKSAAEVIKAVTRIRVTKRPVPMAGSVVH